MGKVVVSLGMGVDSAAIVTRFLLEPETRGFDLDDVIVMTAMTGDEFTDTTDHMEQYLLPLMRRFSVRYIQLSRAGQSADTRYAVLNDSRQPERMHMTGPWRLRDEQLGGGTVPQFAHGKRVCSVKSKGEPMDWWKHDHLGDEHYRHVLGFSAEEGARILKDSTYTSATRHPWFPLADWGWTRADALAYLHEIYGTTWPRSCCVYCPFALSEPEYLADRWRREPHGAALALMMERRAVALNPRSTLFSRGSALQFAIDHELREPLALSERLLHHGTWALYDVRRIYHPAIDKHTHRPNPTKKGIAWRSVETLTEGTRQRMDQELRRRITTAHKANTTTDSFGIVRTHILIPALDRFPATEWFLSIGPAGVNDKRRANFTEAWTRLVDQSPRFAA